MASKKTAFTVGLFMITGLALAVVAIIWLGMSNYFEKGRLFVCYFDESVQGLDKDSPVKYRGVSIGKVHRVNVAPDSKLIEVVMNVETYRIPTSGIAAQLKSVGITGIMFIELDRIAPDEKDQSPKLSFTPEYQVIPTKISGIAMFMEGMGDLKHMIKDLYASNISQQIKSAVEELNKAIQNFSEFSQSAQKAASNIDNIIKSNENSIEKSLNELSLSMQNANRLLNEGVGFIKNSENFLGGFQRNLMLTLENLEKASDKLRSFAEVISDQPSRLIFGKPPATKRIERVETDR